LAPTEHTFTLRQSYLWIIPSMLRNCLLYSCIRFTWTSNIASKLTCNCERYPKK